MRGDNLPSRQHDSRPQLEANERRLDYVTPAVTWICPTCRGPSLGNIILTDSAGAWEECAHGHRWKRSDGGVLLD